MATDALEARRLQRETHHEADVVVVGAGVFGCAAAYALAEQGRSVLLLERWMREPDRIVGELLQPGGIQALKKLGLGHCVDNIDSITCRGYNVIYQGSDVLIPYPTMDDHGGKKTADYFFGQLTIIADGYDSKFRKEVTDTQPVARSKFYALELKDADLPAPGYGHVIIGDASPTLLYQIGTHETRALFDVPHGIPEAAPAAGGVRNYLANHAIPALPASVRPAALAALEDGKLRTALSALYWRRKNYTAILNVLAQALYALFAANDPQLHALRMGCFEYFRRGHTDGPCGLLGGIIHRPVVLAYHFFSVAFLGIWMHVLETVTSGPGPLGVLKLPLALIDAVLILAKACVVFLPLIWREGFR
ncbi:Squalene monooxygenase [Beauveria bassiana]|nr:Squalene monooxygenase [Beauveria bassiana]